MARLLMVQEIKRLGLSESIIEDTISQAYEDGAELEHARRAVEKRLKGLGGKDKLRDRLLRFLQGRGFSVGICFQVVDDALESLKQLEEEDDGFSWETGYPSPVQKD